MWEYGDDVLKVARLDNPDDFAVECLIREVHAYQHAQNYPQVEEFLPNMVGFGRYDTVRACSLHR